MQETSLEIKGLTKYSNNEIYTMHWGKQSKAKKMYGYLIAHLVPKVFGVERVIVSDAKIQWIFKFRNNPLDCSNCAGMVKWIEDIVFFEDNYKCISSCEIISTYDPSIEEEMTVTIKIIEP